MVGVEKLVEKMKNQPHGIKLAEAEKVLAAYGYYFKRQKGSHRHYINIYGDLITLKDNSPLKIAYISELLERIGEKQIRGCGDEYKRIYGIAL